MSDTPPKDAFELDERGEVIPPEGCIIIKEGAFMMTPLYLAFIANDIYRGAVEAVYLAHGETLNTADRSRAMDAHEFAIKMVVEQVTKDTARSMSAAQGSDLTILTSPFPFVTDPETPDA